MTPKNDNARDPASVSSSDLAKQIVQALADRPDLLADLDSGASTPEAEQVVREVLAAHLHLEWEAPDKNGDYVVRLVGVMGEQHLCIAGTGTNLPSALHALGSSLDFAFKEDCECRKHRERHGRAAGEGLAAHPPDKKKLELRFHVCNVCGAAIDVDGGGCNWECERDGTAIRDRASDSMETWVYRLDRIETHESRSPDGDGQHATSRVAGESWKTAGTALLPQQGHLHASDGLGPQYGEVDAGPPSAHHVKPADGSEPSGSLLHELLAELPIQTDGMANFVPLSWVTVALNRLAAAGEGLAAHPPPPTAYNFEDEADRIVEALELTGARMTLICALREAFQAGASAGEGLAAEPPPRYTKNESGDMVCEHGTAADVHCCNCHSGFIFDKDHECSADTREIDLTAADVYQVMQWLEELPASAKQTDIVIKLGQLRTLLLQRGDDKFVTPFTLAPARPNKSDYWRVQERVRKLLWLKFTEIGGGKCYIESNLDDLATEIMALIAARPAPSEPPQKLPLQTRFSLHDITETMLQFGGSFVKQLATLIRLADHENTKKLALTFSEYIHQYDEMRLLAERKSALPSPPQKDK